jgi:hypothetical protein
MTANCAFRISDRVPFTYDTAPIKQAEENQLKNQNIWGLAEIRNMGFYKKHNYCELQNFMAFVIYFYPKLSHNFFALTAIEIKLNIS